MPKNQRINVVVLYVFKRNRLNKLVTNKTDLIGVDEVQNFFESADRNVVEIKFVCTEKESL
jgi:hypothetical protein